jgi:hypothetical protein
MLLSTVLMSLSAIRKWSIYCSCMGIHDVCQHMHCIFIQILTWDYGASIKYTLTFSTIISMAENDQTANFLLFFHLGPGACMFPTHIVSLHSVYATTLQNPLPAPLLADQTHRAENYTSMEVTGTWMFYSGISIGSGTFCALCGP